LSLKAIVYPNPVSSGVITVQLSTTSEQRMGLLLHSFDGKVIRQQILEPGTKTVTLDADALQIGIYVLSITIEGKTETYKIIKR